jgi:hypothetical protein
MIQLHYLDNSWMGRLHPCDHQVRLLASCSILRHSPRTLLGVNGAYKRVRKVGGWWCSQLVSPTYITWSPRQTESALFVKGGSVYKYLDVSGRTEIPELDMVEPIHPTTPIGRIQNPVHHPLETRYDQVVDGWTKTRMSQSYNQSNFHLTLCK